MNISSPRSVRSTIIEAATRHQQPVEAEPSVLLPAVAPSPVPRRRARPASRGRRAAAARSLARRSSTAQAAADEIGGVDAARGPHATVCQSTTVQSSTRPRRRTAGCRAGSPRGQARAAGAGRPSSRRCSPRTARIQRGVLGGDPLAVALEERWQQLAQRGSDRAGWAGSGTRAVPSARSPSTGAWMRASARSASRASATLAACDLVALRASRTSSRTIVNQPSSASYSARWQPASGPPIRSASSLVEGDLAVVGAHADARRAARPGPQMRASPPRCGCCRPVR